MNPTNSEITTDRAVDQAVTQTVQQTDNPLLNQDGIQWAFYQNILDGWIWPTILAILIIVIGNVLETGTFFWFLVPVDVLLFTSGTILGANERWRSALFMFTFCVFSTTAGDLLGYRWAGKLGEKLYDRPDTWFFKKKYLYNAQAYFEKYSEKALYIWRFIVIGSFLPMLAWVARMNIIRFTIHSVLSATIWTAATFIPSLIIGMIWPGITTSWWMLVLGFMIFTVTEMIAWVVLFNQDIKQITARIRASHEQFAAIKSHVAAIKDQVGDIAEFVVKGDGVEVEKVIEAEVEKKISPHRDSLLPEKKLEDKIENKI
jgi:membrane-associated protein